MLSVNNQPIDEKAIETEFKRLMRAGEKQLPAGEIQKQIPELRRQARELAVNRQLLLAEAVRRKIDATNEEIDRFLALLPGPRSPGTDPVRDTIRNACRVEKLVSTVIAAVPEPTDDETMKYLKESELVPADAKQDSELLQKLVDKTRLLVRRLRQNRALTDFIVDDGIELIGGNPRC